MLETNPQEIQQVSEQLLKGIATQEQIGLASNLVLTNLTFSLLKDIDASSSSLKKLNSLLERCVDAYTTKLEMMLEADTITLDDLHKVVEGLQKQQLSALELKRKIVQSPQKLFPESSLTEEERRLLDLSKSFVTQEDKKKFMAAVEQALAVPNDEDFE